MNFYFNQIIMETRNISLTLDEAKEWYKTYYNIPKNEFEKEILIINK